MEGITNRSAPTRLCDRLLSAWNSNSVQIRIMLISLFFYMADVITDILLAVQYYNNGDFHWFGWTLGFVMAPPTVMNILLIFDIDLLHIRLSKCDKCLINCLLLSMPLEYFTILHLLLTGKEVGDSLKVKLAKTHLYEAMLESIPQLCLQVYIVESTHEQVSVLKVITMVISLVAAVKAVVTHLCCCVKHSNNESQFSCKFVTLFTIWKLIELSVRVLTIGLFVTSPIPGIMSSVGCALMWLSMAVNYRPNGVYMSTGPTGFVERSLRMASDNFCVTFSMELDVFTFLKQMFVVWSSNLLMAFYWVILKAIITKDSLDLDNVTYYMPMGYVIASISTLSAVLGLTCRIWTYLHYKSLSFPMDANHSE
ncbi:uncharacterized protein LOC144874169 [Branchiostoma floridae x Branchiostoma japonicum]